VPPHSASLRWWGAQHLAGGEGASLRPTLHPAKVLGQGKLALCLLHPAVRAGIPTAVYLPTGLKLEPVGRNCQQPLQARQACRVLQARSGKGKLAQSDLACGKPGTSLSLGCQQQRAQACAPAAAGGACLLRPATAFAWASLPCAKVAGCSGQACPVTAAPQRKLVLGACRVAQREGKLAYRCSG